MIASERASRRETTDKREVSATLWAIKRASMLKALIHERRFPKTENNFPHGPKTQPSFKGAAGADDRSQDVAAATPSASANSLARSVFSQVNSGSSRPKCPPAAVRRKMGRRSFK